VVLVVGLSSMWFAEVVALVSCFSTRERVGCLLDRVERLICGCMDGPVVLSEKKRKSNTSWKEMEARGFVFRLGASVLHNAG
jgi:hypothetical protein